MWQDIHFAALALLQAFSAGTTNGAGGATLLLCFKLIFTIASAVKPQNWKAAIPSHPHYVFFHGRPNWPGRSSWPIWTQSKPGSNNFTKPSSLLRPPPSIYPPPTASHTFTAMTPSPTSTSLPTSSACPTTPQQISLLWTGLMTISTHLIQIQTCWLCKSSSLRTKVKASSPLQTPLVLLGPAWCDISL